MAIIKLDGGYNALPISYKRGNPIPLDTTAVWYDLEALQTYATSGVTAYVGQVLSLVSEIKDDEGTVIGHTSTAYIIADTQGTLEPIGTTPVGDDKSIVVDEDGTVSLKGVDALTFEREVDVLDAEGNPTGEKTTENVQYQPLMTNAGLVWVEPSKTTVEGLATLIEALTARVTAVEGSVAENATAIDELETALAAEVERATGAETALSGRIDAIVEDYLTSSDITDFETKANVAAVEKKVDDYISSNDTALAGVKATADAAATKTSVEALTQEVAKKATQDDLTALTNKVNTFFEGTGVENVVDTLEDLINYINTHDDTDINGILSSIQAIENKVVLGTYVEGEETKEYATVKAYVEAAIEAIKIGDYAKAADLTALAGRVTTLETKVDVEKVSTAIAAAKSEAISAATEAAAADATGKANQALADAKTDAEAKYVTKTYVGEIPSKDGTPEAENVIAFVEKRAAEVLSQATGGSSESAASVKGQLDTFKAEINPKVTKNTEDIAAINTKIGENIEANAQVNVIETVKVNDVALSVTDKAVNIIVPTKFSDITDDSGFGALISAAHSRADKGVEDAAAAKTIADRAEGKADANSTAIGTLNTTVTGHTTALGEHATKIGTLENFQTEHTAAYNTLSGIVSGHTGAIATKAEQTALDAANAEIAKNAAAIKTINDTTIPAVRGEIAAAAITSGEVVSGTENKVTIAGNKITVAVDAYTTAQVDQKIADLKIADVNAAIAANTKAISDLTGEDDGKTIREIAASETAKIVANADTKYDTLKEISDFIINDVTGAAGMTNDIQNLKNTVDTGDKTVTDYVADYVSDNVKIATAEKEGTVKGTAAENGVAVAADGTMSVNSVNVSKLVQTAETVLVLCGGTASGTYPTVVTE